MPLGLFLFPENVVPVILVGFGDRLLTLAHALLLWCSILFAFGCRRSFCFGLDSFPGLSF
jgi:hypothetical protein